MANQTRSSAFSRIGAVALGVAALLVALPVSARADDDDDDRRHGKHHRGYYQGDYGYYGPPPVYYRGPKPCRGPKKVKVYNYYPVPVAVPVAVPVPDHAYPVYPAYPAYPSSGSNVLVRVGVDWVFEY